MTTQNIPIGFLSRSKGWLIGGLGVALFIALAAWGGVPQSVSTAVFLGGILVMLLFITGLGTLGWHLLSRPLPAGHKTPAAQPLPVAYRQFLAFLLVISGFAWIVGGFWDEVWHRTYGVPFGEDFFWRPHMLIYYSIGSTTLLAAAAFYYLWRHGRGTWQQRFRANPLLGLLILLGGFMAYAIPADPIWHFIYGEDLAAWSIPHIVLIFSFVGVLLLAMAAYLSSQVVRAWGMIWQMALTDWLVIFALGLMLNTLLQGMTTDWEGATLAVLQSRPEWLLPATIVAVAALTGSLANYSLRRVGAATAVGLVALIIRAALRWSFDFNAITLNAWLCTLAPLLALDLWQGFQLWRQERPSPGDSTESRLLKSPSAWLASGVAAMVGMGAVSFPLINRFYQFPTIAAGNLLSMVLACLVAAGGACWVANTVGNVLATQNKQVTEETAITSPLLPYLPPIIFIVVLGFVALFIATASPPV